MTPLIGTARKVREVVPWQTDITRHSWISYRLALINDEARVTREAGKSPDVIYRHYFQLVASSAAYAYFAAIPRISVSPSSSSNRPIVIGR